MPIKGITRYGWLVLVAAFIAAASVYSLTRSYETEAASRRQVLIEKGRTVLEALKAGIMAHGRMGRYRVDRMDVIFEELAAASDIVALQIRDVHGQVLSSGGDVTALPLVLPVDTYWLDSLLVTSICVDFGAEPFRGGGMGYGRRAQEDMTDWTPFPAGPCRLIAALDTSGMREAIQRDRLRFAASVVITLSALVLGFMAVVLLLKRAVMAEELARERERAQRQEQAALLGAGLAHETRNPLGVIRGLAQSICEHPEDTGLDKERANRIVDEVDHVIRGINAFLALARPREAVPKPLNLDAFFEAFLPLARMDAAAANSDVRYASCGLIISADEDLLRRALLNVLLNAFRAMPDGGEVIIAAGREGGDVFISIQDNGEGIDPDDLQRVTEPYFTRSKGGTGLGLTITARIVSAHGWRMNILSTPGAGTEVRFEGIRLAEAAHG